ncbi:anti-sigma factor, partial [Rhizobium ruizarguesonis]
LRQQLALAEGALRRGCHIRRAPFEVKPVSHLTLEKAEAAYWQIGEVAYALIADDRGLNLDQAAERLARSLY